jgi:dihydrodipicolinate synthase/N-acetylneuraminate lyase
MKTEISLSDLAGSVISVPPFAANSDFSSNAQANADLIRHIEGGGVSTLLYGGNANVQNWPVSVYAEWLDQLESAAGRDSWLIPSVGPDWGKMVDHAKLLSSRRYPAAMLLPMYGPRSEEGLVAGVRDFVQKSGVKAIIYIKSDNYISPDALSTLVEDGSVFSVKYAIPRADAAKDPVLTSYIGAIGRERIVSGFGEPPALPHLKHFALTGFTAGCVCIAPSISQQFLRSLKACDFARAEETLKTFEPLETLRAKADPIRVLHTAITLSGIADMGPTLPLLSQADESLWPQIEHAATNLLQAELSARKTASTQAA